MAFFDHVKQAPVDPIFGLSDAFMRDPRPQKVNLSVGIYKELDLQTPIMRAVKLAETEILIQEKSKDYLPIDGNKNYIRQIGELVFGEQFWAQAHGRIHGAQGVGGTNSLRIGGEFLKQEVGDKIYISTPTWPNHRGVFKRCQMQVETYPYYDEERQALDFEKMCAFLNNLSSGSIVALHACCHNPTGADPSLEQWKELSKLMLAKRLIPFFDFAYQGFGRGLAADAQGVRLFAEAGHEMLVACSQSKNFSLYAERIGALFTVTHSEQMAERVGSQIRTIIRTNISNPPLHGSAIVAHILGSPALKRELEIELDAMRARIIEMRNALTLELVTHCKTRDFSYLKDRNGLFSFCGLKPKEVERLIGDYGIYMTGDGRINIVGLNWDNLDYVVKAIANTINQSL
jgi:aspartate/tyrosine/aromatic aminotransferase